MAFCAETAVLLTFPYQHLLDLYSLCLSGYIYYCGLSYLIDLGVMCEMWKSSLKIKGIYGSNLLSKRRPNHRYIPEKHFGSIVILYESQSHIHWWLKTAMMILYSYTLLIILIYTNHPDSHWFSCLFFCFLIYYY